ncbi:Spy/CpxP family protein refolding chaperone [Rhizomicrobium electricum]|uniref:LTXXQ motif family protein n=1 Tax=Rhizomicrobium electricum TaxID=480070 RepID=A0ABP3PEN4_9PROT|nr:Spy/CpxP family protein refolding chaperone [Rhizomicrobium electricum]NIJ48021.1 hypothetical protein [Rhizomicrobium electricum]
MTRRLITAAAALLFASGSALAQTPPPPDHSGKADMQQHFTDMCRDRQAHTAGELAMLETRLQLSDQQKPLFERWKKVKLGAAKSSDCLPPPDGEPTIVDRVKHEEKMLRARLDELKAEQPALEALFASLSPEQKKAFAPPRHPGQDRPGPMRGPGDHGPGTPPPAPEN